MPDLPASGGLEEPVPHHDAGASRMFLNRWIPAAVYPALDAGPG